MTDQQIIAIETEEVYSSVCANGQENSISCQGNYLLYSRCNCPVLYDLKEEKVASLFLGHSDKVNNQHFIDTSSFGNQQNKIYIISTSHDRTAIVWQYDTALSEPAILHQFTAPNESSFTSSCSFRDQEGNFVSITTSIDCSICLWVNAELSYILETRYCSFQAKLFTLQVDGSDHKFLFLAGSDNKIRVFQVNKGNLDFLFELLGHSDWIKCIDVVGLADRGLDFLMASSSQDSYIRVWHMRLIDCDLDLSQQIRTVVSKPLQANCEQKYRLTATLETVLSGHEGIVYGICWFRKLSQPTLQLISCSADKTIIIWQSSIAPIEGAQSAQEQLNKYEQCPASVGVWRQVHRFGETGETNLPFLGVCLSEDESAFYVISLRGAIHSWSLDSQANSDSTWLARPAILGHFGPITDLSWEKSGAYLLSASLDKTCRLHAVSSIDQCWHELARPQVHGHEINCLVSIDPIRFATGAEEKTVRIFKATQFFLKNFDFLAQTQLKLDGHVDTISSLPVHAQLPALGLSNKGANNPYGDAETAQAGVGNQDQGASSNWYAVSKLVEHLAKIEHLNTLPIEEILLQSTLWVESNKLFGHGNELHAMAVDSTGRFLASASKANRTDLASVIIWDCTKFRKNTTIEHHSLTVTRLRFSHCDDYLLSVSRDRTWCLSKRTDQQKPSYTKVLGTTKNNAIHERIIWDCCWLYDSQHFITVSRDKKAVLWAADLMLEQVQKRPDQQDLSPVRIEFLNCSIQAVDACRSTMPEHGPMKSNLVAFGLENGSLEIHVISIDEASLPVDWQCLRTISNYHHLPIRRLAFRPDVATTGVGRDKQEPSSGETTCIDLASKPAAKIRNNYGGHLLASGSDDCIVKLARLTMLRT